MSISEFSNETIEKINYYVYRLIDPRNGETFYVGQRKIYTASFNNLNDIFEGITSATKDRIKNLIVDKKV